MQLSEKMIAKLVTLASTRCFYDDEDEDVIIDDYAGGNVDDAFQIGECAGEIMLARVVLKHIGVGWSVETEDN